MPLLKESEAEILLSISSFESLNTLIHISCLLYVKISSLSR